MRKILPFLVIFLFTFTAYGEEGFGAAERDRCKPTPEQRCLSRGGKWENGLCMKTKLQVKYRRRRQVKPRVSNELRCFRRGGEWRDEMCHAREKPPVLKPETRVVRIPAKSVPVASPVVNVNQQVGVQHETEKKESVKTPPLSSKKEEPKKWWWIGPGAFTLGLYMSDKKEFLTGVEGKLTFALNDRFRVNGLTGYSFWQESNVLLGVGFDVRIWQALFTTFTFDSLWGGFDDFTVKRRTWLLGTGLTYWFGNRADISLRFIFGVKNEVGTCDTYDYFVGGSVFSVHVYF